MLNCCFLTSNSTHCLADINVLKHYEGSFLEGEFCGASSKSTYKVVKVLFLTFLTTNSTHCAALNIMKGAFPNVNFVVLLQRVQWPIC